MSANTSAKDIFSFIEQKQQDKGEAKPQTLKFEADHRDVKKKGIKQKDKFVGEEVAKATDLDVDFSSIVKCVDGSVDHRLKRRFENAKLLALGAVAPKKAAFNLREHKQQVKEKKQHQEQLVKEAKHLGMYKYITDSRTGKKKMIVNTTQLDMMKGNISEDIRVPKAIKDKKVYRK